MLLLSIMRMNNSCSFFNESFHIRSPKNPATLERESFHPVNPVWEAKLLEGPPLGRCSCRHFDGQLPRWETNDMQISPKNTPTATTWWVAFCGMEVYGWHDNAEPFGSPRRICCRKPKTPRNLKNLWWNLAGKLVEPWWNLPRNLLAAQGGSAPENHRESESNSALKPALWLKTPKLLLLWKTPN